VPVLESEPDKNSVSVQLAKATTPPESRDNLDEEARDVGVKRKKSDLKMSKAVGYGALALMGAQILVIDCGFFWYAGENNWQIPSAVMIAWLGTGVLQVIGSVILVVAQHLFPGEKFADQS
jgi:hypothetical protein